ncbi:MAG: Helix-turn-helix domain-containing protein [Candidatus Nitrotoga sp. SPKER]|nr:MAG: Helix-turn-helix domain-containing protein [Candidatus Nitrotoga sp. SPKER]
MNYTHLTREERYQIYALKKAGHKQYEIAQVLKRSDSTISRELTRNCGRRSYRPKQAHSMATGRRSMNARTIDDATGNSLKRGCWSNGARSKLVGMLPSARRRCISVFMPTNVLVVCYDRIYAVRNNARSVTARSIGEARFRTASPLRIVQLSSRPAVGLATGRLIPSSARTTSKLS